MSTHLVSRNSVLAARYSQKPYIEMIRESSGDDTALPPAPRGYRWIHCLECDEPELVTSNTFTELCSECFDGWAA